MVFSISPGMCFLHSTPCGTNVIILSDSSLLLLLFPPMFLPYSPVTFAESMRQAAIIAFTSGSALTRQKLLKPQYGSIWPNMGPNIASVESLQPQPHPHLQLLRAQAPGSHPEETKEEMHEKATMVNPKAIRGCPNLCYRHVLQGI